MDERDRLRDSLLRTVWQEILATTPENVRNFPAAARAIGSGASPDDLVTAMRAASYETAFRLLYLLSSQHEPDGAGDPSVGWALVEFDLVNEVPLAEDANGLEGAHEDLLEADPSGRAGEDLWN